jgi:hypothetical protein
MIVFCPTCKHAYEVTGERGELEGMLAGPDGSMPGAFRCVTPLCSGMMQRDVPLKALENVEGSGVQVLPADVFFRGIHGFGINGAPAEVADVKKVLLTGKIAEVHARDVGQPERTIIERIVMEDGTRLHFASSNRGACVYYVERRGPSCVEVIDGLEQSGRSSGPQAGEGSAEDREEGGRAGEDEAPGGGEPHQHGATELPDPGVSAVSAAGRVPEAVHEPD